MQFEHSMDTHFREGPDTMKCYPRIHAITALAMFVSLAAVVHCNESAWAQTSNYRKGDEIEVLLRRGWTPAVVVDVNDRGDVLAEYEFAGTSQRESFRKNHVRWKYESGAMARGRTWSSSTGTFKIRAALLSIKGDEVVLRKKDLSEITVPLSKLSDTDQRYVERQAKNLPARGGAGGAGGHGGAGGAGGGGGGGGGGIGGGAGGGIGGGRGGRGGAGGAGGGIGGGAGGAGGGAGGAGGGAGGAGGGVGVPEVPPLTDFNTQSSNRVERSRKTERLSVSPDPATEDMEFTHAGVSFPVGFFEKFGAIIPVGGDDTLVLGALESPIRSDETPVRLVWVSLEKEQVVGHHLLPPGEQVLDYHLPSHRLLTRCEIERERSTQDKVALTIWEVHPDESEVTPVVRWLTKAKDNFVEAPWARLVSDTIVLQRWSKHRYAAWDVEKRAMVYSVNQEAFFDRIPTLSPAKTYLLLPEDDGIRIIESRTGKLLSTIPAKGGATCVAMHNYGVRLAALNRNTLLVWDVTDLAADPQSYQAEAIGTPFDGTLYWIDSDRIMVESKAGLNDMVLFSLKHKVALWSYRFGHESFMQSMGGRFSEVVGSHLIYGAEVRTGTDRGLALGSVELPGPEVDEADDELDRNSMMALKSGTPVQLIVKAGTDQAQVQAALEEKIRKNGWVLSPDAAIVMTAEMSRGKTQRVTYRFWESGRNETVSLTPHISSLKIEVDGKTAWSSGTRSGAPGSVELEEGQSLQAEVNRWQTPNPEFYETVEIPPTILHPNLRRGLGLSHVTTRGLVAGSEDPITGLPFPIPDFE
jgi:hypothetical protein